MYDLKQSTAITIPVFAHDANGDAVTGMTDGGFTKRISKNGGSFAAMTVTITEMENGWYSVPISTSHSDTLGILSITFTHASCKQINLQFRVSATLTDDVPTAAEVNAEVDTALSDYDPPTKTEMDTAFASLNDLSSGDVQTVIETNKLDHLVAVAESDDPVDNSIIAKLAASDGDWSGFSNGTDSLEAVRDKQTDIEADTNELQTNQGNWLTATSVNLNDDAITAAKYDESTAFPVASADSGSTAIARTGADGDTLEVLSDEIDAVPTASEIQTELEENGASILDTINDKLPSGNLPDSDKMLGYIQLLARSDAAIETDRSTELGEINADEGSGGGDYSSQTDSGEAIRDRGDAAWTTGGGGSITDILNIQSLIPFEIDLANTATVRIALGLTNMVDDLPTTTEITPGTITIDRKAIGGTSWTNIVNAGACSEVNGLIYYDEVFDSGTGYAEGDSIRITFKNQKITVAANDYDITGTDGWIFQTSIRQTMRGTDGANTTTPPTVAEIQAEMEENGASILDTLQDRLTAARAGYLDKLNVSGTLANSDAASTYQADVSALAIEANVETHVTSSLNSYDPPTRAELTTDKNSIITEIDANETKIDTIDSNVDTLITQIGTAGDGLTGIPWNSNWDAEVQSEATDALNAYDPPTKTEMDTAHALLATPAQVNAQVLDVLNTDTFAEPGQEAPPSTTTLVKKIGYLYKFLRNKATTTSTTITVYNDDGTTAGQESTISDDGSTFTRGEFGSGT